MGSVTKKRFEIRKMISEDVEEVANLIAEVKSTREAMGAHLKQTHEDVYRCFGKPQAEDCAKEDLSFVCIDNSVSVKKIIGYRLCRTLKLSEIEQSDHFNLDEALVVHSNNCRKRFLNRHPDIKLSHHFNLISLGVRIGYDGQGIATKLTECALNNAKQKGYKFAYGMVLSTKAHHIFGDKLKMKQIFACNYDDIEYKGVKFLKGLTNPSAHAAFELDFNDWNTDEHTVQSHFD